MVRWFPCQSSGRPPIAPILPNHPTIHVSFLKVKFKNLVLYSAWYTWLKEKRRMVRWFPCQSNGRPPLATILPNHPTIHRCWSESERSKCHLFWHFGAGNSSMNMRTKFICAVWNFVPFFWKKIFCMKLFFLHCFTFLGGLFTIM